MKRVYNLYRVSGKKQVSEKGDIPMQQIACKNFAEQMNWAVTKEFFEKGISGYKVSANDRDAIQDLSLTIEILKGKISKIEEDIEHCEKTLQGKNIAQKAIDYNYEECLSWAEIFKDAPHDKKKMILSHIFSEIRIGKGYEIEVVYNMTYQQFLEIR